MRTKECCASRLQVPSGFPGDPVPCRVRIVSLAPVLSHEDSMRALFRVADDEHDNYKLLWQPPPEHPDGRPRWLMVRGVPQDEPPKLLSLIAFDALCKEEGSGAASLADSDVGAALLDATRLAANFHIKGKKKHTIMSEDTVESCIRVNRLSGPFGHLHPGHRFSQYRAKVSCTTCIMINAHITHITYAGPTHARHT